MFFLLFQICSVPERVPYSASKASAIFKCFLLLSFACCVSAIIVFINNVQPSSSCGPFRKVDCHEEQGVLTVCYVYNYISSLMNSNNVSKVCKSIIRTNCLEKAMTIDMMEVMIFKTSNRSTSSNHFEATAQYFAILMKNVKTLKVCLEEFWCCCRFN